MCTGEIGDSDSTISSFVGSLLGCLLCQSGFLLANRSLLLVSTGFVSVEIGLRSVVVLN